MEGVKVLGVFASPFSSRVEWALKLKGIEYEYVEEDLANKSSQLLMCNPVHKKVPVLVHNGKPMSESLVILEYIDETWPEIRLLPEDPYEKAMARFWAKFSDEKFSEAVAEAFHSKGTDQEKAVGLAIEDLTILEGEIHGKKFFGREEIGYVDLVLGWITLWLPVLEETGGFKVFDAQKFPSLHEWSENFARHPIIKEQLPSQESIFSHFQAIRQRLIS